MAQAFDRAQIRYLNDTYVDYIRGLTAYELKRRMREITFRSPLKPKQLPAAREILKRHGIVVVLNAISEVRCQKLRKDVETLYQEYAASGAALDERESALFQNGKSKLKGYRQLANYCKTVIEVRQGQDKGMVDIFNCDLALPDSGRGIRATFESSTVLSLLNRSHLRPRNLNVYINQGITSTRGFHVDSHNEDLKAFIYLTDVKTLSDGPYTFVKGSHANATFRQINRNFCRCLKPATETPIVNPEVITPILAPKGSMVISDQSGFHRGWPQAPSGKRMVAVMKYSQDSLADPSERKEAKSLAPMRRLTYEATASQDFIAATNWIMRALSEAGFQPADCGNLAFVAFRFCSRSTQARVYDRLRELGVWKANKPAAIFLALSFELALGGGNVEALIRKQYIDRFVAPQVKMWPTRPIFFWHIPKCSGTSLNAALSEHFYRSKLQDVIPGYQYRPLIAYLAKEMHNEIPYFPSMHFGVDDICPNEAAFFFAVLRDPVRRCLSMYRQEMKNFRVAQKKFSRWHHYRVLPRYGAFWDYRKDWTFKRWLQNIPEWLLLRQLSTFSKRHQVAEAVSKIARLDYYFARDFDLGSEAMLFDKLGINYSEELVPRDLNSSDTRIEVPADGETILKGLLAKEYEMIARIAASDEKPAGQPQQRTMRRGQERKIRP